MTFSKPSVGASLDTWGTENNAALDNLNARLNASGVNVTEYGATGNGTTDDTTAILAAMTAAGFGEVFFPAGTYAVTTLALTGKSCSLRGQGEASVIKGTTNAPVLDLTGYLSPADMKTRRYMRDFAIRGDNTSGHTGNHGIYAPSTVAMTFADISTAETGGSGLYLKAAELCDFERITVNTPAGAFANDVPYIYSTSATNGNRFLGIGIRSVISTADVGVSGAVVFEQNVTDAAAPTSNTFSDWWFEFLHLSDNTCLFSMQGNFNTMQNFQEFDIHALSTLSVGTSWYRLKAPAGGIANYGGNIIAGRIMGGGTFANAINYGIEVSQSGNLIQGIKRSPGNNVHLNAGVTRTTVILGGSEPGATAPAVIDDSATTGNTVIDNNINVTTSGPFSVASATSGPLSISSPGFVTLGNGTGSATLDLKGSSAAQIGIGHWVGGTQKWLSYMSSPGAQLFIRDMTNARQHVTYVPGTSSALATTTFSSQVIASGPIIGSSTLDVAGNSTLRGDSNPIGSAAVNARIGPLGSGALWIDASSSSNANVLIALQAKGTGIIEMVSNAQCDGTLKVVGNVGFNGTTPISKPAVTGSRGGNAALASLLTALASYGIITDSSTA